MEQERKNQIPTSGFEFVLGLFICLVLLFVGLFPAAPTVQAQRRYIASPTYWFEDKKKVEDKIYPDWVVEFEIPLDATNIWAYTTTAGIESRVLAFSTTDPNGKKNGKKLVTVTAGYRARKCTSSRMPGTGTCNYTGGIDAWARSLRLRYYR